MLRSALLLAVLALSASVAGAQDASKPNILVIWGDDVGWANLSSYGDAVMGYRTPNESTNGTAPGSKIVSEPRPIPANPSISAGDSTAPTVPQTADEPTISAMYR